MKKELKKAQMLASELELKLQESEQSQRRNEKHEQMLHGAKLAELEMELVVSVCDDLLILNVRKVSELIFVYITYKDVISGPHHQ